VQLHPFVLKCRSSEFSTISGVAEDVTEIILTKQVRFKRQIEDIDNEAAISLFQVKTDSR
jgi:DNA-directed RNA polymerase alpha subunit